MLTNPMARSTVAIRYCIFKKEQFECLHKTNLLSHLRVLRSRHIHHIRRSLQSLRGRQSRRGLLGLVRSGATDDAVVAAMAGQARVRA
jgi:hypothetical protein